MRRLVAAAATRLAFFVVSLHGHVVFGHLAFHFLSNANMRFQSFFMSTMVADEESVSARLMRTPIASGLRTASLSTALPEVHCRSIPEPKFSKNATHRSNVAST
jgi:hypothetical protein